jgi:uncharacterized protein YbjT (DUF2867 family)
MPLKIIITGVTGMVGEGVLHECLLAPEIEKILVVTRKSSGTIHPKLSEIILTDFFNPSSIINSLSGYDACFFCLGVSSVGMKKEVYEHMTYDLTMGFAKTVLQVNPGMQFCYISGASTDSTEKGRMHWARVKGKTENDLQKLGFSHVWLFRPAALKTTKGMKNTLPAYKWFSWLFPLIEIFSPNSISSLAQLGQAMIRAVTRGYDKNILEVKDIKAIINY